MQLRISLRMESELRDCAKLRNFLCVGGREMAIDSSRMGVGFVIHRAQAEVPVLLVKGHSVETE